CGWSSAYNRFKIHRFSTVRRSLDNCRWSWPVMLHLRRLASFTWRFGTIYWTEQGRRVLKR
ncbi:MAG: hypothetical protein ABFR90_03875, partial [Planctomycetota bacterium]